jgi:hypothetical protein
MFKTGEATLKNGTKAIIFEITENKIYGKHENLIGGWSAMEWYTCGSAVGPGFPSHRDLMPNDAPPKTGRLSAFVSANGTVRFAVEGSMEEKYFTTTAGMKREPRFDILERDV